ncbi:sensor domain-containing diguanylate cyclase [Motiliproteus coralliicola]|uniref:Sensor domain-containing diguanylate cyclase n=1 Tax=Motiliproteus coralliicola TaxID=2283196 RepID=A0A369WD21_9GAMM|nr:GGDEF domain-containing protein [Motiliproteus coralliicola]RDE19930.1 sensor domain-containing diguanylate cyclase [Motiliproteus coralliicola]
MLKSSSLTETNLLQAVINAVPTPIFFKDAEGRYLGCNRAFENYIGLNLDQLVGKSVFELFDPELAKVYYEADKALYDSRGEQIYEAQVRYADGSIRDVMFHKAAFHAAEENIDGIVGAILDITARKDAERELEKRARTDSLTGLANRFSLMESLDQALERQRQENYGLAFWMLDLDHFKQINDTFGHPTGDTLLKKVAVKLQSCLAENSNIARLGGDEFSVILEGVTSHAEVEALAATLIEEFSKPIELEQNRLEVSVSIGIAMFDTGNNNSRELMKQADIALYQAKDKGRARFQIFKG